MTDIRSKNNVDSEVSWLSDFALQLSTINPSALLAELEPLKTIIGSAKIVGMGEATHGSKEFTLIRHRLFRFLVEEMGFCGLILETPQGKAKAIDTYIKTGEGNPKELLKELGYWVHNTQEMLDVVEWMRSHNSHNPSKQISFIGCDIPVDDTRRDADYSVRDEAMADICIEELKVIGAEARVVLWSHNMHISYISDGITTQGQFLRQKLGSDYIAFVSLFNEGQFTAVGWNEELEKATGFKSFDTPKAPADTYEYVFANTKLPLAVFDLQQAKLQSKSKITWLKANKVRDVGAVFDPKHTERLEHKASLLKETDNVIWIDKITSSTPLFID